MLGHKLAPIPTLAKKDVFKLLEYIYTLQPKNRLERNLKPF